MKQIFFGGIAALGLSAQGFAYAEERAVWISSDQSGGYVTLQAYARLNAGESGWYDLTVRKVGDSGQSTTRQGGRIQGGDGKTSTGPLLTTRLSFRSDEKLIADLVVQTSEGRELRHAVTLPDDN